MNVIVLFYVHRILSALAPGGEWSARQIASFCRNNKHRIIAFQVIHDQHLANVFYAYDSLVPVHICYTAKSSTYLVKRSELWFNRIVSFAVGVVSGMLIAWLSHSI